VVTTGNSWRANIKLALVYAKQFVIWWNVREESGACGLGGYVSHDQAELGFSGTFAGELAGLFYGVV